MIVRSVSYGSLDEIYNFRILSIEIFNFPLSYLDYFEFGTTLKRTIAKKPLTERMRNWNERVRCCQNWKMSSLENIHKSRLRFWSTRHKWQSQISNFYFSYAFYRRLLTFFRLKNVYEWNPIDHNTPYQDHCTSAATLWRLIYYAVAFTCQTHAIQQYADLEWNIKVEKKLSNQWSKLWGRVYKSSFNNITYDLLTTCSPEQKPYILAQCVREYRFLSSPFNTTYLFSKFIFLLLLRF